MQTAALVTHLRYRPPEQRSTLLASGTQAPAVAAHLTALARRTPEMQTCTCTLSTLQRPRQRP